MPAADPPFADPAAAAAFAGFPDPARDLIRLNTGQTLFRQLEIGTKSGDALIDTGTGTIRLEDIKPGDLDADHFVFG